MDMNKLLILDGNSVLHRAYYALPDWRNRSGEATAGVYGFLSMMLKSIEELKPTHLAVVFDHPSPTFRHTMYVGYQTNREKDRQISEDIWGQIEKLREVCKALGVPVYQLSGFEADDLIGTIAKQCSMSTSSRFASNVQCSIITGDRDLMQLVNENVNLFMPVKGVTDAIIVDREKVKERLGVWPEQVIDYKALVGDGSDNYPGVTGIGPKGAIDLITNYSNFENIYNSLDKIIESTRKRLVDGYEGGVLSGQLATIKTDVPITFDIAQCSIPNAQKITEVLRELGYKSLLKRVEVKVKQEGLFD